MSDTLKVSLTWWIIHFYILEMYILSRKKFSEWPDSQISSKPRFKMITTWTHGMTLAAYVDVFHSPCSIC